MSVLCKNIPGSLLSFVEKEITYSIVHDTPHRTVLNIFYLYGHASTWGGAYISIFSLTALNYVQVL